MMKNKYYMWTACFLVGMGCSKDKGNYDYTEVNRITVIDAEGEDLTDKNYDIRVGGLLRIKAVVSGTLSGTDQSDFSYYWLIDKDTIGRTAELALQTDELGIGNREGKLVVIDRRTDLAYNANFRVRITAGISKGSFILTENENKESTLVLRDLNTTEPYLYINQFNGVSIGSDPISIQISSSATSATNTQYRQLVITTATGENPIFVSDLATFLPTTYYPQANGTMDGNALVPSYVWMNPRTLGINNTSGLLLSNGKCYNMAYGLVSIDIYGDDPLDYDFGQKGVAPSLVLNGYFLAGFDQKNERMRVFGNNLVGGGSYTMNYDHLVDPQLTKGHAFIAASEMWLSDLQWQFLTRKGNEVFMHNAVMDISTYPYSLRRVTTIASHVVPEMLEAVNFVFSGQYWYFAKGRTIYQCSPVGLDIVPYLTLPIDGSGDIVAWNFNQDAASRFTKIGIATYNAATTNMHKGSYYLYDINEKKYDQRDLNVIDKAVDIKIGL